MVGTSFDGEGKKQNLDKIKDSEIILDIGPNTIGKIKKKIDYKKIELLFISLNVIFSYFLGSISMTPNLASPLSLVGCIPTDILPSKCS